MTPLTQRSERLLKASEKLRQRLAAQPNETASLGLLDFGLGNQAFALPLTSAAHIERVPTITFVPNTPPFVRGISNLRGQLVPVIDLAALLKIQQQGRQQAGLIVMRSDHRLYALITHSIPSYFRISPEKLQASPTPQSLTHSIVTHTFKRLDRISGLIDPVRLEKLIARQTYDSSSLP